MHRRIEATRTQVDRQPAHSRAPTIFRVGHSRSSRPNHHVPRDGVSWNNETTATIRGEAIAFVDACDTGDGRLGTRLLTLDWEGA